MSRQSFVDAIQRKNVTGGPVFGSPTSIACRELMDAVGAHFPEAHVNSLKMAALALAGHTVLRMDVVMPLFSVSHEAAAMGCNVNWGSPEQMTESGKPIFGCADDIRIPSDLLTRPGCRIPLEAIAILRKQLGDAAAVCGKALGPWTLAYHLFGVENFLIGTIDDPGQTRRILERLTPITLAFARAQVEAGADCILLPDHATRDLCGPRAYRDFLQALHDEIARQIGVPTILHICGDTSDRIGMIAQTSLACFHYDTKTGPPAAVRKLAGERMALMGGISNYQLLRGTKEQVAVSATQALAAGIDVVGPECAIPLGTPLANLKTIAAARG